MSARDIIIAAAIEADSGPKGSRQFRKHEKEYAGEYGRYADAELEALTAAGYRILGPDDLDKVTVERCAEAVKNHTLIRDANVAHFVVVSLRALQAQEDGR